MTEELEDDRTFQEEPQIIWVVTLIGPTYTRVTLFDSEELGEAFIAKEAKPNEQVSLIPQVVNTATAIFAHYPYASKIATYTSKIATYTSRNCNQEFTKRED